MTMNVTMPCATLSDYDAGIRLGVERLWGDNSAWMQAVARNRLFQRTGNNSAASDVAQETCVRILQAAPTFEHVGQLRAYFSVAIRSVIASRRRPRQPIAGLPFSEIQTEFQADAPDRHLLARKAALTACFAKLSEKEQLVLKLRFWDGLTCRQIAKRLGEARDAIRMRCYRAQARLRRLIREYES